jgi:hypothetical protein
MTLRILSHAFMFRPWTENSSWFAIPRETLANGKAGRGMSDKISHFNGTGHIRRES